MLEMLKIMLGDSANNYSDPQLKTYIKLAQSEVEGYCNRKLDTELEMVVLEIAKVKLNRLATEGLASQSYSGVSENYIDGYPTEIMAILNRKRKIKMI